MTDRLGCYVSGLSFGLELRGGRRAKREAGRRQRTQEGGGDGVSGAEPRGWPAARIAIRRGLRPVGGHAPARGAEPLRAYHRLRPPTHPEGGRPP
eukprot:scaffold49610_cov32-Prasinocladus_malaysianus.AAC.1